MNSPTLAARSRPPLIAAIAIPLLVVTWAYWPCLTEMYQIWKTNAQYSHGYLVPAFAAVLLYLRRDKLVMAEARPSWWGLPFLAVAAGLFLIGDGFFGYEWLGKVSLLPTLAGVILMVGGWAAWRWAWPAVPFLFFMIPLPFTLNTALVGPLQTIATTSGTYVLQTLGFPAIAEGNVIHIGDYPLGIAEACSGLSMLIVFFALSTGMALVARAPLPDKLVLVASSLPIALLANLLRIVLTAILFVTVNNEAADVFFHDVAGWLMMPLALGIMWLELKAMSKLFVPVPYVARSAGRGRQRGQTASMPPRPRGPRPPRPTPPTRKPYRPQNPVATPSSNVMTEQQQPPAAEQNPATRVSA